MIRGTGCDLTDITRIARALERFGPRFAEKILSARERESAHGHPSQYLAGRFAAKEAAVKALGTGFQQGITMQQVEILSDELGAPCLHFSGAAQALAHKKGVTASFVSISHERNLAMAFVVLEG